MAVIKSNQTPSLPSPIGLVSVGTINQFLLSFINSLNNILQSNAVTMNATIDAITPTGPVPLKTYVKAALPVAATYINNIILVSNDVGGLTIAFSDGTNWRRVSDRAVIS